MDCAAKGRGDDMISRTKTSGDGLNGYGNVSRSSRLGLSCEERHGHESDDEGAKGGQYDDGAS